jgi:hypothetical protein
MLALTIPILLIAIFLAVHLLGLWSLLFLAGFVATFIYGVAQSNRQRRERRAQDTQRRIAELERELGRG